MIIYCIRDEENVNVKVVLEWLLDVFVLFILVGEEIPEIPDIIFFVLSVAATFVIHP